MHSRYDRVRQSEQVIKAIDGVLTADAESKGIKRIGRDGESMVVSRPVMLDEEQKQELVAEVLRILSE